MNRVALRSLWTAAVISALGAGCAKESADDMSVDAGPAPGPMDATAGGADAGAPAITIAPDSVPGATVGATYTATLTASGGSDSDYTWALETGQLPAGLTLTSRGARGIISGTPTAAGSEMFTVEVTDGAGAKATRMYTLRVVAAGTPLMVEMNMLPVGQVDMSYAASVSAVGGSGTGYQWVVQSGALPAGLALGANGTPATTLTGTPTEDGTFMFTVEVTDSEGATAQGTFELTIEPSQANLRIVTMMLPDGRVDEMYNGVIEATGGNGIDVRWSIASGAVPPGLMLIPTGDMGMLTGTPTTTGSFTFTVQIQDSTQMATREFTVNIAAAPLQLTILEREMPDARVGRVFTATLAAVNGTAPYTWAVVGGMRPPGLGLDGAITATTAVIGIPTTAGQFNMVVQVTDSAGNMAVRDFGFEIVEPIMIGSGPLPVGAVGEPYMAQINTGGGSMSDYRWQISFGSLPAGLMLEPMATPGTTIAGVPSQSGIFTPTIRVTDSNGDVDSRMFQLQILPELRIVTSTAIPTGVLGVSYSTDLRATGGTGMGYQWTIAQGSLPPGLTLQPNGTPITTLDGTPTMPGFYQFVVQVTDSAGRMSVAGYGMSVMETLDIATPALHNARPGGTYTATVTAIGGTGNFQWRVSAGSLPVGLTLTPTGTPSARIVGTTSQLGVHQFDISVTDDQASSSTRSFALFVGEPRHVVMLGDLAVDNDDGVFVVDIAGPMPSAPVEVSPSAPGTGDVNIAADASALSPDGNRLAYIGDFRTNGVEELFITNLTGPFPSRGVVANGTLVTDGDVVSFKWSPDSRKIAYQADQDTDGVLELYVVDVSQARPGPAHKASGALVTGGGVAEDDYRWSPDSRRLAYLADQFSVTTFELFSVDASGATPLPPLRVNLPLQVGADVDDYFLWTLDSSALVYHADQSTLDTDELWIRDVRSTTVIPQRISGPLVSGGDVRINDFVLSPDGAAILYTADQETDGKDELYMVDLTNSAPGARRKLNPPLTNAQDVFSAMWTPDSQRVLYVGDVETDGRTELFLLDLATGSATTAAKVNVMLPAHADVQSSVTTGYRISSNGAKVAYRADVNIDNVLELYVTDIGGPPPYMSFVVNPPLPPTTDVNRFWFAPNSASIFYAADQNAFDVIEVFFADISGPMPGPFNRLNSPLPAGGDVLDGPDDVMIRREGTLVVYRADQQADNVFEAFVFDFLSAPFPQPINPPLPMGGDVKRILVSGQ